MSSRPDRPFGEKVEPAAQTDVTCEGPTSWTDAQYSTRFLRLETRYKVVERGVAGSNGGTETGFYAEELGTKDQTGFVLL